MSETTPITIAGVSGLQVNQPYNEGHVLTANEAAALNQTYAENIRNNTASKVTAALIDAAIEAGLIESKDDMTAEVKAQVLESMDLSELQELVNDYQSTYEFGVRRSGSGVSRITDPVEIEAMGIARTKVREAIKAKGHKLSDVGTDKINELAAQVLESYPQIREQAKSIVAARQSVALSGLEI